MKVIRPSRPLKVKMAILRQRTVEQELLEGVVASVLKLCVGGWSTVKL